MRRNGRRARARCLIALLSVACVRNAPPPGQEEQREVAVWDFPIALPEKTLHLWPVGAGSPLRSKRHLETKIDPVHLTATVSGDDPYFVWQLETPLPAFGVHVVVDAAQDSALQLFWSTPRCPVFSEPCSSTVQLEKGRHAIEFFLDPNDPLRELRLDLPEHTGAELVFDELSVLRTAEFGAGWTPNSAITRAVEGRTGLSLDAAGSDPWITLMTPGLDAARITGAELVLRGPAGSSPQLYWGTRASGFTEPASAHFEGVDASGDLTHRAALRGRPGWTGKIDQLRFDPGNAPGAYVVERLALVYGGP